MKEFYDFTLFQIVIVEQELKEKHVNNFKRKEM